MNQHEGGEAVVMWAVLALLADEREARIANDKSARSTESLLETAGFSTAQIAELLDKNYRTVQSTLRRDKER
jgi:hypothetical protein